MIIQTRNSAEVHHYMIALSKFLIYFLNFLFLFLCCCCLVAKSCVTLCDLKDCSLSGSSIHGIFQARILEWVAICFSRGFS